MAWPESSLPLESVGESVLLLDDEVSDVVELLLSAVVVLVVSVDSAAWAARPTARVPAMLAATSAPVIAAVRLSPLSRSIGSSPSFVDDSMNVTCRPLLGLCHSWALPVNLGRRGRPANRHRAVPLTYEQFRYAFANAVSEEETRELYDTYCVPAPGAPLFQAATANLNPWTEAKVDTENPYRGPLLIISGEKDHTVPRAISDAAYKKQLKNPGTTEFAEIPGRGHALTIDSGWLEVAQTSLAFVERFTER